MYARALPPSLSGVLALRFLPTCTGGPAMPRCVSGVLPSAPDPAPLTPRVLAPPSPRMASVSLLVAPADTSAGTLGTTAHPHRNHIQPAITNITPHMARMKHCPESCFARQVEAQVVPERPWEHKQGPGACPRPGGRGTSTPPKALNF